MATVSIVDTFPKAIYTKSDVVSERSLRLSISGVVSSDITEDATNWILTTVFNAGAPSGGTMAAKPVVGVLEVAAGTQFGSLVAGGFFSSDPSDHSLPRAIRTNNPGALNISAWQKSRVGYVGETEPDGSSNHNVTTIYRTPEHGVGSWFHLLSSIYGFGGAGSFTIQQLAQSYAGTAAGPQVASYIGGWTHFSPVALDADTSIDISDDGQMLNLAKAMFGNEAGKDTPLHDDQITYAIDQERAGTLPA